jgi:hypothetical protein
MAGVMLKLKINCPQKNCEYFCFSVDDLIEHLQIEHLSAAVQTEPLPFHFSLSLSFCSNCLENIQKQHLNEGEHLVVILTFCRKCQLINQTVSPVLSRQ